MNNSAWKICAVCAFLASVLLANAATQTHEFGSAGAQQYVYSDGRTVTFTAIESFENPSLYVKLHLAGYGGTFHCSFSVNGIVVDRWDVSGVSQNYAYYEHNNALDQIISAGDSLVFRIWGGTMGTAVGAYQGPNEISLSDGGGGGDGGGIVAMSNWRPSGWVYCDYPWAYDSGSGDWYWFNMSDTKWVVNLADGQWMTLAQKLVSGSWFYYSNGGYMYVLGSAAWHWLNATDKQWAYNFRTDTWSLFGEPAMNYSVPYRNIVIDGSVGDWDEDCLVYEDTDGADSSDPGKDIRKLYIAQDSANLYVRWVLNGPMTQEGHGYKFGSDWHTYVAKRPDGSLDYFLAHPTQPQPSLPTSWVGVTANGFEQKIPKTLSHVQMWNPANLKAWYDEYVDGEWVYGDYGVHIPPL